MWGKPRRYWPRRSLICFHSRNAMTSSPFGRNSAQLSFDRFSSKGASICNLVREIIRPGKGNRIVIHRLYF